MHVHHGLVRNTTPLTSDMVFPLNRFRRPLGFLLLAIFLGGQLLPPHPALLPPAEAFSVAEEREVGEKLLAIVRNEFKLLDDPDISQYINRVGQTILEAAGSQFFDYHFFVVKNREFNAFAAPSGLIFIHSGLLEAMESEDELAGVLAHEIGHAASRHIADRIAKTSKVSIGTAALVLAGIALGGGPLSQALMTGGMAAGASMNLKFSREDEEEADRLAFRYMEEGGRDPQAMVTMMRKMRAMGRYRPVIPPYLLTHPEPEQRMNYVQDLLLHEGRQENGPVPPREDFEFQRIKQRVLALTRDPMSLLPLFKRKVEEGGQDAAMARYGLFQLYRVTARFEAAEEELRRVMAAYPEKSILMSDLGVLWFEAGRFEEALAQFQQVRAMTPDDPYNTYYLAGTLQQLGRPAEAGRLYDQLLPVLPNYSRLYYQLSLLRAAQGRPEEGYYYLGVYHWQEGEADTARQYLKQAVSRLDAENSIRKEAEELLKKIDRLEKV